MSNGAYAIAGSEFLANSTTSGVQNDATITALATGGFVVSWTDASGIGGDSSGSGIKARLYDANGGALGSEFLVNTTTANAQDQASVAVLGTGGFVVTWTDASAAGPDPDRLGIKAQMFDANGGKIGSEFLVNSTTRLNQNSSVVTGLASGGFVITWVDASATAPDANGTGIRAQIYNELGLKVGGEFLVNTTIAGSQQAPVITGLASGGFVASWVDSSGLGGDPTAPSIKAQVFTASGAKSGAEFLVNTTTAASQDQPTITSLSNGGFVVVWRDTSLQGDTSGPGLKAQVFTSSGAKVGTEFQVNTTEFNTQDQPTVTGIAGGGFAVSWRDNSLLASDASGFGVKTQVFDDLGHKVGAEIQVNSTTLGTQELPSIASLASGALVIGWTDRSGLDGDPDGGIKMQILSPTTGTISNITLSSNIVSEAAVENTTFASLSANGASNAVYSYEIVDDSTGGAFAVQGNRLVVQDSLALDYESASSATLTIRATDGFGHSFDKVFGLAVTDSIVENRYGGGSELLANTSIANNQQLASITAIADDHYVITWTDGSGQGDTSVNGIKGRIVDADGNPVGGEFLVNTQTLNSQDSSAVAGLASGGFVVTWSDNSAVGGDTSSSGIKAQMFDANGSATGGEFLVNASTLNAQKTPVVAGLASGGFVVTWSDASGQGGDSSVSSVKAQLYNAAGNAVGSEFLVNTNTANAQDTPVVTGLTAGGFVVSWHDSSLIGGDTSKDAVKAQLFDAAGAKIGGEFLVNSLTQGNQQQESITALSTGGFVVTWADASQRGGDPDNYGIAFQIYDASGAPLGGQSLANTTTAGAQLAPAVSALADGGFIISWADYSGSGPEVGTAGIKAQIFTGGGVKIGGEFIVNGQLPGIQADPTVAAAGNGGFAVAWTDYGGLGGDDLGTSVKYKIFDPLAVQGGPPPLIATADILAGTEDQSAVFQISALLANDTDSYGLPISISSVTAVSGGSVVLDGNGGILFTPFANFSGAALFTYAAGDSAGNSATGHVTINVAGVNDAPTAFNDSVNVSEDGGTIPGGVLLANDKDPDAGDKLTIQPLPPTTSAGANLSLVNGIITYSPGTLFQQLAAGQTASDSFGYTVADQGGSTSSATVSLTIIGANDAPTNLSLSNAQVNENATAGTVVGTLAGLDVDQGDTLSFSLTNSAGGRFVVNPTTGVVSVASGAVLDYEAAPSQSIVGRATDSAGLFVETSFTIALNNLPEPKSWTGDNGVNVFTAPTNDLWTINGLGGNDVLTGNASADTILGGAGIDTLDGAAGADSLVGGIGNDTYYVDNIGDKVVENAGEGTDLVIASVDFTLDPNIENLTQAGSADIAVTGNDLANTVNGNSGANVMRGGLGGDLLTGNDGNDLLWGEDGGDFLLGSAGADTLIGGVGADELTGGAGADIFLFDYLGTSAERDKVKDFVAGEDLFQLSRAVFTAFANLPAGAIPASGFFNGAQAVSSDQHVIYQQSTGNLYYDPDGVGGIAQIQIGLLSTKPVLAASSFILI